MGWKFIDELLGRDSLRQAAISALNPDCNVYDVMLLQHKGDVDVSVSGVKNSDRVLTIGKFRGFFGLASHNQPDILAAPEYSCPWDVVEYLIENGVWPRAGKIWVVGCESICPDELDRLRDRHNSVHWLVSAFSPECGQIFLDPVCLFFSAYESDNTEIRVIAIQLKGHAMADGQHLIEPNSLILGTERYILRNDPDTIHMAVLICSDALEHNIINNLPHMENLSYLILHFQLNPDPRNTGFREYRDLWGNYDRRNIEILCLNWARGTNVFDNPIPYGGSAWYYKSPDVTASDEEVNASHHLGAYYMQSRARYFHCHILNYDEHIFCSRCIKVSQTRTPAVARRKRTGPMAVTSFSWDSVSNLWQAQNMLDDGFLQCCNSIGRDLSPLTDAELSPVNKERLVCLSCADITIPGTRTTWYEVQALPSFDMTSEEVCNRVTFSHDPDVQSRGLRFRRLQQYSVLRNEILADNVAFPDHLSALRANARIQYPAVSGCFDYNIATSNGEYPAIFVYLGEIPESMAREKMEDLEDILKDSRRALVVWFRQDGQIKYLFPEGLNHFDSALEESPKSFLKDV